MSRWQRWSRRKLGDEDESPVDAGAAPGSGAPPPLAWGTDDASVDDATATTGRDTPPSPAPKYPSGDERTDASVSAEGESGAWGSEEGVVAELPDPDSLAAGSDIRAYLAPGVGEAIRKRALRRLFSAERYGVRDGLDDYDDDFRARMAPMSQEVAERMRQWWQDSRREPPDDDIADAADGSATGDGRETAIQDLPETPPDTQTEVDAVPVQESVPPPEPSPPSGVAGAAPPPPRSTPEHGSDDEGGPEPRSR
ncbi:DUF3306 domain-containing protein [Halomonas sp. V046]|uniref:DUF3306 domain-containing protein n=1 Tax=Halomonas sp. V046 TaxID=3459611 RepID=UPI00404477B8